MVKVDIDNENCKPCYYIAEMKKKPLPVVYSSSHIVRIQFRQFKQPSESF